LVSSYITSSFDRISLPSTLEGWEDDPDLATSVERIIASESPCPSSSLSLDEMLIQIHIYQPSDSDSFEEFSNDNGGSATDGEEVMAASVCELPNRSWEGLWDSLIFADNIKLKLLDYIHATLVLSDANVDCEHQSISFKANL
jgi:pachytene checkpoint protein 2